MKFTDHNMLIYEPHYFQAFDKNETLGLNATVVINDKAYWDLHKELDPHGIDPNSDLVIALEKEGFYELQEGVYESGDEFDSFLTTREKMLSLGLIEKSLL